MEKRFGIKDLVLIVLLVALLISVWLSMTQFDRQWEDVRQLKTQVGQLITEQAQTRNRVAELQGLIEQGVTVSSNTTADQGTVQVPPRDPFERLKQAHNQPGYADGDWMIDAFGATVAKITPLASKDGYSRRIQNYVLEALIGRDPDTLEWIPHIARSWEIEDNSEAYHAYLEQTTAALNQKARDDPSVYREPLDAALAELDPPPSQDSDDYRGLVDKVRAAWVNKTIREDPDRPPAMTVTFHLRNGVVFSDGTPLTAHDVVFSWELLNNPKVDAAGERNFFDNVETYTAVDDYTVVFTMREPHYLAFSMAGGRAILAKHFYERFTPEQINTTPGLLFGSGPYRMSDPEAWAPGKLLQVVKNERYWGVTPAFGKLIWKEITNDVARLTEFRNGEIDLFSANPEQYETLLKDETVVARSHHYAYDAIPSGYRYIAWNQKRGGEPTKFADKRVRQAMTFLTERQRIADEVLLGYAYVASGPFPKGSPQADPDLEPRPYNVEKGKQLLAEAGWMDRDGDGVLENAQGEPFRFKFTYPGSSDIYNRIVLFLKDSYARAGIVMELDPLEFSVLIQRLDNRTFDACMLAWGGGAIESDIRQMFHTSQIEGRANNFMSYSNPELDRLIDAARRTIDESKRMDLWRACHRILYEDQPYTFMNRGQSLRFIDGRIRNIQEITTGLNDRDEWFVPAPDQKWTQ